MKQLTESQKATATLIVGQRLHCILYGGRDGIIYEIRGDQTPATIGSLSGCVRFGGSAHFQIVFDDGTRSHMVPESIVRGVQWHIYEAVATPDEIKEALTYADAEHIRRGAEEQIQCEQRQNRRAQAIAAHPHLEHVAKDGYASAKLAAKNIRTELKRAFPGHKFSVRSSTYTGGDSVDIHWDLGPTEKEVEAITGKYQEGSFNGMEDIYETDHEKVWPDVFGGAKYVHESRSENPGHATVAAALCAHYQLPVPADGAYWNVRINQGEREDIGCLARQIILQQSYPPGAILTGIERTEETAGQWREFFRVTFTVPGSPGPDPQPTTPQPPTNPMARYNPLKPNKTQKPARPAPLAKGTIPAPEAVSQVPTLTENEAKDGFELRFPTMPGETILSRFHATKSGPRDHEWHWHRRERLWYARRSDTTRAFALALIAELAGPAAPPPVPLTPEQTIEGCVQASRMTCPPIELRRDEAGETYFVYWNPRDNCTYGTKHPTREALEKTWNDQQDASGAEFRAQLVAMTPAELQAQADYWLKLKPYTPPPIAVLPEPAAPPIQPPAPVSNIIAVQFVPPIPAAPAPAPVVLPPAAPAAVPAWMTRFTRQPRS